MPRIQKFIEKYGEIDGNKLWDNYILNKKLTSKRSKEYLINKGLSIEEAILEIKNIKITLHLKN